MPTNLDWRTAARVLGCFVVLWAAPHVANAQTSEAGASDAHTVETEVDAPPSGTDPAETDPEADTPCCDGFSVEGMVDLYYGFNFNRPSNQENFSFGGSTGRRHNAFSLNLISLGVAFEPDPVGFRLVLQYGLAADALRSGEPVSPGAGLEVLRAIQLASLIIRPPETPGFEIEAGVFPSHVGLESFVSKDNWNYTRGWMGETVPYTQTGVRVHYDFDDRFSGELHVLNGWQTISDNNDAKTIGTRVAYDAEKLALSFNTLIGPERDDDNDNWRLFGDLVMLWTPNAVLSLGASADMAWEAQPGSASSVWGGGGLLARVALHPTLAVSVRGEIYHDEDGVITGVAQTFGEGTLTLEATPWEHLLVKLEGRYDRSSQAVFFNSGGDATNPGLGRDQFILLLSAVATGGLAL